MPLLRNIFFLHAERRSSHRACIHLLRCLQLREKREELNKSIAADEEEKGARSLPISCLALAALWLCRHRDSHTCTFFRLLVPVQLKSKTIFAS